MPDHEKKSISATEAAALFELSPYVTLWMLYQRFANGVDIDDDEDERMTWGKRLQPLIVAQGIDDLALEIVENAADKYVRRGFIGCTRDAEITCPDRGPGAFETKCCFDYRTWMDRWSGGDRPPRDIEIQLQVQMAVGDGKTPFAWGVIAIWCAGDVTYFERKPDKKFLAALDGEAKAFFDRVRKKDEPDPFGVPREIPLINKLWPKVERATKDLTDAEHLDLAETARMYKWAKEQKASFTKLEKQLKAKLMAAAEDCDVVELPDSVFVDVKKSQMAEATITPDMVGKIARKASVRTTIKVSAPDAPPAPPDDDNPLLG